MAEDEDEYEFEGESAVEADAFFEDEATAEDAAGEALEEDAGDAPAEEDDDK